MDPPAPPKDGPAPVAAVVSAANPTEPSAPVRRKKRAPDYSKFIFCDCIKCSIRRIVYPYYKDRKCAPGTQVLHRRKERWVSLPSTEAVGILELYRATNR